MQFEFLYFECKILNIYVCYDDDNAEVVEADGVDATRVWDGRDW